MANNLNITQINDYVKNITNSTNEYVTSSNNLTLIDPAGTIKNNSVNQEDLFIYATLKARIKNKAFVTSQDDEEISISFLKNKDTELGAISSDFLSTNWTEIGNKKVEFGRDLETFGIENIEISINAGFIPTVSIDFVDVRGATLFEQGSCSPYAAFFYQPYPIFELTVKGYYGYPIKYYLAIKSFTTSFDASTGNYKSKGEFIGYSYAFLSDILLGYVMAAPFMDGAKDILKNIYAKYNDLYEEREYYKDGNPFDLTPYIEEPITLYDYFKKIEELKVGKGGNPSVLTEVGNSQELERLNQISRLQSILDVEINTLVNEFKQSVLGEQEDLDNNKEEIEYQNNETNKAQYEDFFIPQLNNLIDLFEEILNESFSNLKATLSISKIKDYLNPIEVGGNTVLNLKQFNQYIEEKEVEINNVGEQVRKAFSEAANTKIKQEIGFIPTIRSFFTVLIANTELFLELLKKASEEGENYHEKEPDEIYFNGDEVEVSNVYYAWPSYNQPEDNRSNSGSQFVERYPGIKFPLWPEVKFVEDFYLALETINQKIKEQESQIADLSSLQDVPGRDNYMSINAMETPAGLVETSNSYFNLQNINDVYKTIGERFVLMTNYTNLNEVNLRQSIINRGDILLSDLYVDYRINPFDDLSIQVYTFGVGEDQNRKEFYSTIPLKQRTGVNFPYYSYNLFYKPDKFKDDDYLYGFDINSRYVYTAFDKNQPYLVDEVSEDNTNAKINKPKLSIATSHVDNLYNLGAIEGHNLIDTFKEDKKMLQNIVNILKDPKRLKKEIINALQIQSKDIDVDRYYTSYRYKPEEGIILNPKIPNQKQTFKPNIHEMEGKDLFKIQTINQDSTTEYLLQQANVNKDEPELYFNVINESASSLGLNAYNRDFGIEQLGELNTEKLEADDVSVYAPTSFYEEINKLTKDAAEEKNNPEKIYNLSDDTIVTSNVSSSETHFTNMFFNAWNGALSTINYGNDLSKTIKDLEFNLTKTSNFTSQNPKTIVSRGILDIYPDYLFPYHLDGFKERFTESKRKYYGDFPYRFREYGAIEINNLGMYTRVPRPLVENEELFDGDSSWSYEGGLFTFSHGLYDQNLIQYSPQYTKPFDIDPKVESQIKTLNQLKGLTTSGEEADRNNIDYIKVGYNTTLNKYLAPGVDRWEFVREELIKQGLIPDNTDPIPGLYSQEFDDGSFPSGANFNFYLIPLLKLIKKFTNEEVIINQGFSNEQIASWSLPAFEATEDESLGKYLAGPTDYINGTPKRNKLSWFVAYEPEYEPDQTNYRILTTSRNTTFDDFYNQTINGANYSYSRWNSNEEVGAPNEGWDELIFFILGGTIEADIDETTGEKIPKEVFIPIVNDFKKGRPKNLFYDPDTEEPFGLASQYGLTKQEAIKKEFERSSSQWEKGTITKGVAPDSLIKVLNNNLGFWKVGNRLNAGNTLVESPFWRHNFPAPELGSDTGKAETIDITSTNSGNPTTVYFSYWGGKYFNYSKTPEKVGTHLPVGIRIDLDSWENSSIMMKPKQETQFNDRKYILTQHNKHKFNLSPKKTADNKFKWKTESNHEKLSNYNRSKNWKGSLAYLWLSNHFHRPWAGSYSNTNRFYGPLQTLGTASIAASIPKATLLLLGAVLWRMREAGLLISDKKRWNISPSDNAITDSDGKYLDPINVPIVPKKIRGLGLSNRGDFDTEYFGFTKNSDIQSDSTNGTYTWNNGVRPPMACLYGFGSSYSQGDANKYNHSTFRRIDNDYELTVSVVGATAYAGLLYVDPDTVGDNVLVLVDYGESNKSQTTVVEDGLMLSCFPRADEWPALNLGMAFAYDFFGSNGTENPFKNQYKIWTPFFSRIGALMQRFPNQSVVWFTRQEQLDKFKDEIRKAREYAKKYTEDFEFKGQQAGSQTTEEEIEKAKQEVSKITTQVKTLEEVIGDNPKLCSVDESYTKLTILQHNANFLDSRQYQKKNKEEDNYNDFGRSEDNTNKKDKTGQLFTKPNISNTFTEIPQKTDYIRGYTPIGPELWFLPTSVKEIIIKLFEDYVGDFNNFGGNANSSSGSDFDKILAIIDPLNFPNPIEELKKKKYPNALYGDLTPYSLKEVPGIKTEYKNEGFDISKTIEISEINDIKTYGLPQIDGDGSASIPEYPEALKRWERAYSNAKIEGRPYPPIPAVLSQTTEKKKDGRNPTDDYKNILIDYKSFFPTGFYVDPDQNGGLIDNVWVEEIKKEYVVASATPRLWWGEYATNFSREETQQEYFYFNQKELDNYVLGMSDTLKSTKVNNLVKNVIKSGLNTETSNQDNDIKLGLYRSLQSIYNKWISSSSTSDDNNGGRLFYNPIGQTEDGDRLLIDHFSFVNRINSDVGNKAVIDLETVLTLKMNIQNSIFGVTSDVLDKSNFAFHPLPAYVDLSTGLSKLSKSLNEKSPNYRNNVVKNMFLPQTTSDVFEYASGPHYLCMYVGGNSKALDLSRNKEDKECLRLNSVKEESKGDSGLLVDTIGSDTDQNSAGVVGFKVKFADQNQSHFTSISLDQAEYKNTNESLRAIEMISRANQPDGSGGFVFKGQSLYEVFLNRSYSCTVEALGNMMIQPLQYFELENVPMFYGSYLIRDVKHTIKPHNVQTSFTGDRIPQTTVPLIEDVLALYDIQKGNGSTSIGGQSTFNFSSGPTGSYDLSNIPITTDNQKIIDYLKTSAVNENGEPTGEEFKLTEYQNLSLGKEGNWAAGQPSGIDLHWTAGYTTTSAFKTLKEKRLGYHIVLGEDGVAYNFSPLDQKASHGGCGTVYPNSNKSAGTCRSQNSKAIGISYVGGVESGRSALYDGEKSGVAYARTWEQWQEAEITVPFCPNGTKRGSSGLFVCADNKDYGEGLVGKGKKFNSKAQWNNLVNSILFAKSNYPTTIKYITTHYMHDSNKVDVGKDFPFDELITALKAGGWEDVKIITEWTAQDTGTIIKKDTLNQTLDEYVLTNAELQEYEDNDGQTTPGEIKEITYEVSDKDRYTLLAICARENYLENEQGMADVAQAIVNRLGSGKYKFTINDTNAIASIITDDKQFEPTFTSNTDQSSAQVWKDIKDWSSAIKAVQYKKGTTDAFTEEKATEMLKTAYKAIYYKLEEARSHVQGRTDFKATTQYTIINNDLSGPLEKGLSTEKNAEIIAGTRPPFVSRGGSKNNVFGFAYNYKDNITYTIKSSPCCPLEFIPPSNPNAFT